MNTVNNTEKEFGFQHFPVGTTVEINVSSFMVKPIITTVTSLHRTGPRRYVISTDNYNEITDMFDSYHISHVTKIIKRGPGIARIVHQDFEAWTGLSMRGRNNGKFPKDTFSNHQKKNYVYSTDWKEMVANVLPINMMRNDMIVDIEKMKDLLMKSGALRTEPVTSFWFNYVFTGCTKRMKSIARRVLTKCLLNHRKYNAEVEEANRKADMEDMEREASYYGNDTDCSDNIQPCSVFDNIDERPHHILNGESTTSLGDLLLQSLNKQNNKE